MPLILYLENFQMTHERARMDKRLTGDKNGIAH